jgi:CTP synthase (UTP-ammonia lyase)
VLGLESAEHAEYGADPETALITLAACEVPPPDGPRLHGTLVVRLMPGSRIAAMMGTREIRERFTCSYQLNPLYQPMFEESGLRITGTGAEGEARVVELEGHPFFIGTLFLPQLREPTELLHPLVRAFVEAACSFS